MKIFIQKIIKLSFVFMLLFSARVVFAELTPSISSVAEGGSWNNPATWVENRIPSEDDIVQINGLVVFSSGIEVSGLDVSEGSELRSSSNYYTRVITVNGDIENKGILSHSRITINSHGSIDNQGLWTAITYLYGEEERSIIGEIQSYNFHLENDVLLNSNLSAWGLKPNSHNLNFSDDDYVFLVNDLNSGGDFETNGSITLKIMDESKDFASLKAETIISKKLIVSSDARISAVLYADFIIESDVELVSSPNYGNITVHGNIINSGLIPDTYGLNVNGNIFSDGGDWSKFTELIWPDFASLSIGEIQFGSSSTSFEKTFVIPWHSFRLDSFVDPENPFYLHEEIESGNQYYWRIREYGNPSASWSEIKTINVPFDNPEPEELNFFNLSQISDIDQNESFDLAINALDSYEGELILFAEQGEISPHRVSMNGKNLSISNIIIKDAGGQNKITVIADSFKKGISNFFTINSNANGSIIGNIEGSYAGATAHLKSLVPGQTNLSTSVNEQGKFIFENLECKEYYLSVSGESLGKTFSSQKEKINVSCGGPTYHTITTISFANCNPEGLTPVLLVPGILGSTSKGAIGVYPDLPKTAPKWDSGELKLHDPGYFKEELGLFNFNPVGFKKIKEKLEENEYQRNCTIFDAPYYWPDTAEQNVENYLKKYIDHAKKISGQEQVDIIAHSMGGIVTRSYIQSDYYQGENGGDIRRFAMVGTPNQGAALPYYIWEGGDVIGADTVTNNISIAKPTQYLYSHSINNYFQKTIGRNLCKNLPNLLNPYIRLVKDPHCNRRATYDFVRHYIPSLKELLFTYSGALIDHETNEEIKYTVNTTLSVLNTNYDILKTNFDGLEARLFVGVQNENSTLQKIRVLTNHDDIFYQEYGYPQYEDIARYPGDGTVPQISIELDGIQVYDEYNESHGALPNIAADDLVEFITSIEE